MKKQNVKGNLFVQGDVFLHRIEEIPQSAKQVEPSEIGHVLAYGEATGHYHSIPAKYATITKLYEREGKVYLAVFKACELMHPEHRTVVLPVGNFEVGRVREYDPFLEETRRVLD